MLFRSVSAFAKEIFPGVKFSGVTLAPVQARIGNQIHKGKVDVRVGDYSSLTEPSQSFDAAFFVESICHSTSKAQTLISVNRVLKNGGRLVIADGFRMKPLMSCNPFWRWLYTKVCRNYYVQDFADYHSLVDCAKSLGLSVVSSRDVSFRIAPTTIHAVFLSLWCYLKNLFLGRALTGKRLDNLVACFLSHFLGLNRNLFRYYIITFQKV